MQRGSSLVFESELLALIKPSICDRTDVEAFKQEFFDAGESTINGGALLDQLDFPEWLDLVKRNTSADMVPDDWVVASTLLARRKTDNVLVGIIDIRHSLGTEFLATYGGHIGYSVRPSERHKGYAAAMLKSAIQYARNLGIDELMLGCYSDNVASIKTIEKCGGCLSESKVYPEGKPMNVYWINC